MDGKISQEAIDRANAAGVAQSMSVVGKGAGTFENLRRIPVKRSHEIQQQRLNLPVCGMEQEIVEAIVEDTSGKVVGSNGTDVVILCGETGSGKSTQVPQFLYEYGLTEHGMVGITQPRRVATTSTAERVANEMGYGSLQKEEVPGLVGYQIRHDSASVSANTKIKFMTDGILLQEMMSDFLLRAYSVIILDEAHERNINTDVLLGLLSRCLPVRRAQAARHTYAVPIRPLKLVIMSATLRVSDFMNPRLFPSPPPIIRVEARQYVHACLCVCVCVC
eukprot:GSChrysophyteH2.ASY1.ANO1.112.1 assembled CDS